jgi:hypothetical protein
MDFMGNCTVNAVAPLPLNTASSNLSSHALAICTAIDSTTSLKVSTICSFLHSHPPHQIDHDFGYFGGKDDYGIISWAGFGLYDVDCGFG